MCFFAHDVSQLRIRDNSSDNKYMAKVSLADQVVQHKSRKVDDIVQNIAALTPAEQVTLLQSPVVQALFVCWQLLH
jgi:hypothetical protein